MSTLGSGWGSNVLFATQNQQFRNLNADSAAGASVAQIALMALRAADSTQQSSGTSDGTSSKIEVRSHGFRSLASLLGSGVKLDGDGDDGQAPVTAKDFMKNLRTLVSSVESGDTETAQSAAQSLQATLDSITPQADDTSGTDTTETTVTVEITDTAGSTDASQATSTDTDSPFLTDLKTLLSAVQSGDTDAAKAAADKISDAMHSHDTQGPHGPPPGPRGGPVVDGDTASSLVKDLTTLFSAVEAGDTESAQTAATSVEATLTQISAASSTTDGTQDTSDTGTGFMADLKNLLTAVKGGDMQSAQTGLDTITSDVEQAHHHGGGMRMPAPDDIQQASDLINGIATLFSAVRSGDTDATGTAADSLQTMLDNLAASSPSASADDGTDATGDTSQDPTQSTFISDLQGLLDALKTGNTSDSKLWTVLTAYKEEQTAAV